MSPPPAVTRRETAMLGALVFAGVIVYLLLNRSRTVPDLMIDEILYGQMAKSAAAGEGATWRGQGTGVQSAYSYLIAPGWAIGGNPVDGYVLGRSIGVIAVCLTAVPAWLVGRELADGHWRWIVPVGAIAGSWMVFSGRLLTENLAYPLATATLAALVIALARGRSRRWLAAAAVLSLAACAVRMQLLILPVVLVAAIAIDLLRTGRFDLRKLLGSERVVFFAAAGGLAVVLAGLLMVWMAPWVDLGDPVSLLGRYKAAVDSSPEFGTWLYWFANCLVELALMTGVVPVVAMVALAFSRDQWRDRRAGALLSVAVPLCILLISQVAWFSAADSPRLIDRYLVYAVPLLLAALAIAPGRFNALRGAAAAVVIGGLTLTLPMPDGLSRESDALVAAIVRTGGGLNDAASALPAIAFFVFIAGTAGALLLSFGSRRGWCAVAAVALTVASVGVIAQHAWLVARDGAAAVAMLTPEQRDWIDRADVAPVAMLSAGGDSAERGYLTEFFNDDVSGAYVISPMTAPPAGAGFTCVVRPAADGTLSLKPNSPKDCEPPPSAIVPRGERSGLLFADVEREVVPLVGENRRPVSLIVNRAVPRIRAVFETGCGAFIRNCRTFASLRSWLDEPATALLTVRSGRRSTRVRIGNRTWVIARSDRTFGRKLRVKLPAGRSVIRVSVDGPVNDQTMPWIDAVDLSRPNGGYDVLYRQAN